MLNNVLSERLSGDDDEASIVRGGLDLDASLALSVGEHCGVELLDGSEGGGRGADEDLAFEREDLRRDSGSVKELQRKKKQSSK